MGCRLMDMNIEKWEDITMIAHTEDFAARFGVRRGETEAAGKKHAQWKENNMVTSREIVFICIACS